MTILAEHEVICAVCGEKNWQTVLESSSSFGQPDLDFRPSEMLRSTMETWLMECPRSGYISDDIRKKPHMKKEKLQHIYDDANSNPPTPAKSAISLI